MWPGPGTEWGLSKWELLSRITYCMPPTLSSPLFPVHYWLSLSLNLFNNLAPFFTFHLFLRNLSMLPHSVSSPTNFCPQKPQKDPEGLFLPSPNLGWRYRWWDRLLSVKRQIFKSQWDAGQNFSINFYGPTHSKSSFQDAHRSLSHPRLCCEWKSAFLQASIVKTHCKDSIQFCSSLCELLTCSCAVHFKQMPNSSSRACLWI